MDNKQPFYKEENMKYVIRADFGYYGDRYEEQNVFNVMKKALWCFLNGAVEVRIKLVAA